MTDRKKLSPLCNVTDERFMATENNMQFLNRMKVRDIMQGLLRKILANKPDDPIAFIIKLLENKSDMNVLVHQALDLIKESHHSQPSFFVNVNLAYKTLMNNKAYKNLHGINGVAYTQLLQQLCKDLPVTIQNKMLKRLESHDYEMIPFDVFRSAIFSCCILFDYVQLCDQLYTVLNGDNPDSADAVLCDIVIMLLHQAISRMDDKTIMSLEAMHNLSPESLNVALEHPHRYARVKSKNRMKRSEFITDACSIFFKKIKVVKTAVN